MYRYSCMWKITPKEVLFALLKGPTTNLKKSFGGKSTIRSIDEITRKNNEKKKLSLLAGIFGPWKKKSAFFNWVWCWSKYTQWVLVGKIVYRANDFLLSEMKCIYFLKNRRCSNSQKFFSSRQPSIRKKK